MQPGAVTLAALAARETVGGATPPRFTTWPLTLRLTIVEPEKVPLPPKPTSQVWPARMGPYCSQPGLVAVRFPEASGAETLPFQPVPTTWAVPASLKTTSNEVMGLAKDVSVRRTTPL